MAPLPRLERGVDRSAARHAFSPRSDDRQDITLASREANLARLAGVNLFVIGSDDVVSDLFAPLWPSFVAPIIVRYRGERLRLPTASTAVGTLVIYDLQTLTPHEQHALNAWVRVARGRAWVVSTSTVPLLPMVESGAFNDGLYYRLNAVTIDLTPPVAP